MKKLFTLVLLLCVFTTVNAKRAHVVKHTGHLSHSAKRIASHKKRHSSHHHLTHTRTELKFDPALLAQIDTCSINKYKGIQYVLYTLVKELGKPYKLGSSGPTGFDCSGLMNYAFSIIGVQLPRTSTDIGQLGEKIAFDELRPGDLVFFTGRNNNSRHKHIGHVGCVYKVDPQTGKVLMIHSSDAGVNITEISDSKYYMDRFITARRILGSDTAANPFSRM